MKLGINGFGRIGRLVFRAAMKNNDAEVVAINDPLMNPATMAHLVRFDSVHGRFDGDVKTEGGALLVNGKSISIFAEKDPASIPWGTVSTDVVCESSGVFNDGAKCEGHIKGGCKKVIISAPATDDTPVYVMGVNHANYDSNQAIVSNASSTTNCLAPLAKVLHDNFGVVEGLTTTVDPTTPNHPLLDGGPSRCAGSCASSANISKVIPALDGRLTGMAFRLPAPNVPTVDLNVKLAKSTTMDEIVKKVCEACDGPLKGVMGVTDDGVVSQDFVACELSCVLDVKACVMLNDTFVKLVSWHANEWGSSNRLVDLACHITANISDRMEMEIPVAMVPASLEDDGRPRRLTKRKKRAEQLDSIATSRPPRATRRHTSTAPPPHDDESPPAPPSLASVGTPFALAEGAASIGESRQSGVTGVSWDKSRNRWDVKWREGGVQKRKRFTVERYGEEEALRLASAFRREMEEAGRARQKSHRESGVKGGGSRSSKRKLCIENCHDDGGPVLPAAATCSSLPDRSASIGKRRTSCLTLPGTEMQAVAHSGGATEGEGVEDRGRTLKRGRRATEGMAERPETTKKTRTADSRVCVKQESSTDSDDGCGGS